MFHYSLPSAVGFIIVFDSYFILINQICVLGAFNKAAFGIFSAFFKEFVKIRHYGFLSSTWKRQKLKLLQEKLKVKVLEKVEKKPFLPKCPCCKTGNLHRIADFDQRDPPAWYLDGCQSSSSCPAN